MLADDARSRARYRTGLAAYQVLAAGRNIGGYRAVSAADVRDAIPGFAFRSGGFRYWEGRTDDARLTIEVTRAAHAAGAVLANHARVDGLLGGDRVTGATVVDEVTGQRFEVQARVVVNATGVWADRVRGLAGGTGPVCASRADGGQPRLVPSKGVHLVFGPGVIQTKAALVVPSAAGDGRYLFVVPWEDRVYAGTTDTRYAGDLDHPAVDDADREYVLAAVGRYFPAVTGHDVVASWAGLRPLLDQGQAAQGHAAQGHAAQGHAAQGHAAQGQAAQGHAAKTADLSREHRIVRDLPGLFTITGGKLTTYRAMAHDLTDRVAGELGARGRCQTRRIPLGLHGPADAAVGLARAEAERLGLAPRAGARLVRRYGDDWREALAMIGRDRSLGEPAAAGLPVLNVELELARSREMAITDEDVLVRRTRLTTRDTSVTVGATAGKYLPTRKANDTFLLGK
jgi:glycerol-3-phosphate dehydrogenase